MKSRWLAFVGTLLMVVSAALLAEGQQEAETEKERREDAADRLIEMSIVLGRLERLKGKLEGGEAVGMKDLHSAVGRADGPQERLISEKQALQMLEERLSFMRERGRVAEREMDRGATPAAPELISAEMTVEQALQRMGPPSLPENSRELGHLLRESGQYGLALDAYRRIRKSERTAWDRFNEAVCLEGMGNLTRARSLYRSVSLQARGTPLGEHARWVAHTYFPMLAER